jgi:hypothetical protein
MLEGPKEVVAMRNLAHVLRITGVVLTSLFAGLGILFAAGYAFEDPGGWQGVALFALAVVPLGVLTWAARKHPAVALRWVLAGVVLLFAWPLVERFVDLVDMPVVPQAALVLSVPAAVLGLRNARRGAELLLLIAASPALAMVMRMVEARGPEGEGPSLGDALGWSSGIVVVPLLLFAAIFLVASLLDPQRPEVGGTSDAPAPRAPEQAAR